MAVVASIRWARAMHVRLLKSHMVIPFLTTFYSSSLGRAAKIEYCILIFNTDIPELDIFYHAKVLKGVVAYC
jgi:hypothetical protein